MNPKLPNTPFSTPLSGSAREAERRIQNIMSGPKRRPPLVFIALVSALCLLCGNLVSCHMAEPEESTPVRLENIHQGDASPEEREHEPSAVTYQLGEDPLSEGEQQLLEALFRAAERENGYQFQVPTAQLMSYIQKDGLVLGTVFVEDHLENTLILGIMDKETGEVPHTIFRCSYHNAVPNIVTFRDKDGEYCLLYTFNGQENGQYTGEAGVVRLDGNTITWTWPVEGSIQVHSKEYRECWSGHLAVLAPGGVDVYTVNPEFEWGGEDPWSMWQLDHGETFYRDPSSAEELPMPIYFQTLNWLIEATNNPGGWRIVSLALDEERSEEGVDCYTLTAREELGGDMLTAGLFFPYVQEGQRRAYEGLDRSEVYDLSYSDPGVKTDWLKNAHKSEKADDKEEIKDAHKSEWADDKDDWDWDWDWDVWDDGSLEAWKKEREEAQITEYQSVGVTMDGKDYYCQGQLVNVFLDQRPDKSVWTLDKNPAGTVHIKILRSADGAISGVSYMTDAEAAEVWDGMD